MDDVARDVNGRRLVWRDGVDVARARIEAVAANLRDEGGAVTVDADTLAALLLAVAEDYRFATTSRSGLWDAVIGVTRALDQRP